ncbi:MAG: hypothetical protein NTY53_24130 [Kiritimatiellaeota bacterium]|nr:hypothetical protein [Kiritimatiellota bacterium]
MNRLAFVTAKVTFRFFILSLLLGGLFSPQVAPGQSSYNWSGLLSTDWNTAGNWGATGIAPTGTTTAIGSIYVTNRANNALFYTAADGTTIFTSGARCFRIADGAAGALYITGGTLNCIGTGDLIGNGASAVGLLQIDGGTYISTNGNLILGGTSSTGTFTINSGTAVVATVQSGVDPVGHSSTNN